MAEVLGERDAEAVTPTDPPQCPFCTSTNIERVEGSEVLWVCKCCAREPFDPRGHWISEQAYRRQLNPEEGED